MNQSVVPCKVLTVASYNVYRFLRMLSPGNRVIVHPWDWGLWLDSKGSFGVPLTPATSRQTTQASGSVGRNVWVTYQVKDSDQLRLESKRKAGRVVKKEFIKTKVGFKISDRKENGSSCWRGGTCQLYNFLSLLILWLSKKGWSRLALSFPLGFRLLRWDGMWTIRSVSPRDGYSELWALWSPVLGSALSFVGGIA